MVRASVVHLLGGGVVSWQPNDQRLNWAVSLQKREIEDPRSSACSNRSFSDGMYHQGSQASRHLNCINDG